MLELSSARSTPSLVVASYPDGIEIFELPDGATLIDLAQRLDGFAGAHVGAATEISIRCQATLHTSGTQPSSKIN